MYKLIRNDFIYVPTWRAFEWFWHEVVWIKEIEQVEKFIFIDDQAA